MGVANIIPGVSGGTIALITEIYEDLIKSLKSIDLKALQLLFSLNLQKFIRYTNFYFLLAVFGGSVASVFSVAKLFEYLFKESPILIWSLFFGLILASVLFVAKKVKSWSIQNISSLILGCIIASSLLFIPPATENSNLIFIFICGAVSISGMLLPGLSGSFILILMGNYELIFVTSILELNYLILGIFILGSIIGLIGFSHVLNWLLKNHKDLVLSLLSGFIIGSLLLIWPWKEAAKTITIDGNEKILSYNWYFPEINNQETMLSFLLIILGVLMVYMLERFSLRR